MIALLPLLSVATVPALAPAADDLLALAPADAALVITIDDLASLRERARRNSWFRFGADPEVARLSDHFLAEPLAEAGAELDQALGSHVDLAEVLSSLSGSAVVFVEFPGSDPDESLVGALLQLGENRERFDRLVQQTLAEGRDQIEVRGMEYGGAALTLLVPADGSAAPVGILAELGETVAIVAGADRAAAQERMRGVVDRWGGTASDASLADDLQFIAARTSAGFTPDFEAYVDLSSIWRALEHQGGGWGTDVPPEVAEQLTALSWFHAGGRIGTGEDLELAVAVSPPEDGLLAGFGGLFGGVPIQLLARVPRHSVSVSTLSLDVAGLWAMLTDILRSFSPEAYADMQRAIEASKEAGIDPIGDILGQLSGAFARFSVEVPPSEGLGGMAGNVIASLQGTQAGASYGGATVIGLRDPIAFAEFVEGLVDARARTLHAVEKLGEHELHTLGDPGFASLHWAYVPHGVVIGMKKSAVREALRMLDETAPSILEKRRFADILESNRGATKLCISETETTMRSMLAELRTASTLLPLVSSMTGTRLPDGLPIGPNVPWPDPTVASRYFEGTMSVALTWDQRSLRWHLKTR